MKSFLDTMRVEGAKHAHNCQHSARHRIKMGDPRLTVRVGRTEEKFCKDCAVKFLREDAKKIDVLVGQLEA